MKSIIGALLLVPVMAASALAQAPTADPKEGKIYLDGGIGIGVASMAFPVTTSSTGFDAIPVFGLGLGAEYGITDKFSAFTKMGLGMSLSDDPGTLNFGMTFDAAYKFMEKKGDAPALTAYAGLGFLYTDLDPKVGPADNATDFVFEIGIQASISLSESMTLEPWAQMQLLGGDRPFNGYNGVLQIQFGAKLLYKLSDQLFLEPFVQFSGGNFSDSALFGVGIQFRL